MTTKRQLPKPEPIYKVADRVTRSSSEPEDIDLAAEATEGTPAKSLAPAARKPKKAAPRRT